MKMERLDSVAMMDIHWQEEVGYKHAPKLFFQLQPRNISLTNLLFDWIFESSKKVTILRYSYFSSSLLQLHKALRYIFLYISLFVLNIIVMKQALPFSKSASTRNNNQALVPCIDIFQCHSTVPFLIFQLIRILFILIIIL